MVGWLVGLLRTRFGQPTKNASLLQKVANLVDLVVQRNSEFNLNCLVTEWKYPAQKRISRFLQILVLILKLSVATAKAS